MSQLFRNVLRTIRKGRFTALAATTVVGLLLSASGARAASPQDWLEVSCLLWLRA